MAKKKSFFPKTIKDNLLYILAGWALSSIFYKGNGALSVTLAGVGSVAFIFGVIGLVIVGVKRLTTSYKAQNTKGIKQSISYKVFLGVVGILAIFGAYSAIKNLTSNNLNQTNSSTTITEASIDSSTMAEFKKSFVESCETVPEASIAEDSGISMTEYCGCVYDYLIRQYGEKKLFQISLEMISGERDNSFSDEAATFCLKEQL